MIKQAITFILSIMMITTIAQADNHAESLTARLQAIHTMQADFSQTILNKSSQLVRNTEGTMALQRPGLFRWQVTKPLAQLIVANGKKLWIYDKDLEQVTIRRLASSAGETPALLLSDASLTLDHDFYIKKMTENKATVSSFQLLPKDKSSLFASVTIRFVGEGLDEMRLQDHLGQTIVIQFKHAQINKPLASSLFHVVYPPNTDVIDETKQSSKRL